MPKRRRQEVMDLFCPLLRWTLQRMPCDVKATAQQQQHPTLFVKH